MNDPFKITKLTGEMMESATINPVEPHRHDHEELIIITHGAPTHFVDFTESDLIPPVIVFVAMGKVHSFHPDLETRGWSIRYSSDFLPQSHFNFYSNFSDQINYPLSHDYCSSDLNAICEIMLKEYKQAHPNYNGIRHLLSAVLVKLEAETRQEYLQIQNNRSMQTATFNSFLKILDNNYKRPEGVDFYADKLNMSSRNLNLISQSIFGKSITEIIETRKLIEARRFLLNSEMSISEIGYELGYNEKSYFSRVFRKKTGVTPSEFREKMQPVIS
jgi:AraC family transcriptional regulator, transcriptional activator of pobA